MIPSMSLSLSISQQNAKLGFQINNAKLEYRAPQADLEITQKPAQMEIDQGPGTLEVDGEAAHAALGHKSTGDMIASIAEQARQVALEAIAQIAGDGDQLAKINGASIADIALQHQELGPMPIDDVGPFSSDNVKITYTPHPTKINWTPGGAEIHATPHPVEYTYTPGHVDVYVAQQNWLKIDIKGQYMNMTF